VKDLCLRSDGELLLWIDANAKEDRILLGDVLKRVFSRELSSAQLTMSAKDWVSSLSDKLSPPTLKAILAGTSESLDGRARGKQFKFDIPMVGEGILALPRDVLAFLIFSELSSVSAIAKMMFVCKVWSVWLFFSL
jgi:hypothetical protein